MTGKIKHADLLASQQEIKRHGIVAYYSQAIKGFAKRSPRITDENLLLSFDGEMAGSVKAAALNQAVEELNAGVGHPVTELLDQLFSYIMLYPTASHAHSGQLHCKTLYTQIHSLFREYYHGEDKSPAKQAALINGLRTEVWKQVKNRQHGYLYNAFWRFLARTAHGERVSQYTLLSLEDLEPYRAGTTAEQNTPEALKSCFPNTIAAARKIQAEASDLLQAFFNWISSLLASLGVGSTTAAPSITLPRAEAGASPAATVETGGAAMGLVIPPVANSASIVSPSAASADGDRVSTTLARLNRHRRHSSGASPAFFRSLPAALEVGAVAAAPAAISSLAAPARGVSA